MPFTSVDFVTVFTLSFEIIRMLLPPRGLSFLTCCIISEHLTLNLEPHSPSVQTICDGRCIVLSVHRMLTFSLLTLFEYYSVVEYYCLVNTVSETQF